MQAVILCGGKGTRLSGMYPDRPKALVPVRGRPFLEWQLTWLARGGIGEVHLAAGHMAASLRKWLDEFQSRAAAPRLTFSVEPLPLGTGGGLKFAEPWLRGDPVLVLNGDSLLPALDWAALAAAGDPAWSVVVAVTRITDAGRYGTVELDAHGRIRAFREKAEQQSGWVNGGVYRMARAVLARIPAGREYSLEQDLFPVLAAAGGIGAVPVAPPLLDMGTPEGLALMERVLDWPGASA